MDKRYARAVELVVDLRDLSARKDNESAFSQRLQALRAAHARKWTFIDLLKRTAGGASK